MASLIIGGVVGSGAAGVSLRHRPIDISGGLSNVPCLAYNPSRNAKFCVRDHLFVCGNASAGATRSGLLIGDELRRTERVGQFGRSRGPCHLNVTSEGFSSPKTGTVGADRFKDGAVPGTYWSESNDLAEEVAVHFNTGTKTVTVNCRAGENLLKVAEGCSAMIPNLDFCFEGTCCHCEMEVEGGAAEVGYRADTSGSDLIRSCICPVPRGRHTVHVNILSEEDAWGDGVL